MRICADYHLDYNLSYKDIHKNILFKIIEKFKIKTKDLNISLGYNDWFAYELLKKHVQHVRKRPQSKNNKWIFHEKNPKQR
ncbi:hypothetical protein RhiirB3_459518 [Rhizophagus irregularis]|nr:hypothetical protein RhiirB3_459518 [Rhizophagus irregularis]